MHLYEEISPASASNVSSTLARQYSFTIVQCDIHIQPYFNDSNVWNLEKKGSRKGKFELMSVYHSARSGGITGNLLDFLWHKGMLCVPIRIA